MFLLAIESSTKFLSLAVFRQTTLLEEAFSEPDGRGHAEKLLPLIDQLLKKQNVSPSQLSALVASKGPGSYTSLRVGLATAMGLSRGKLPIYLVSSLKSLVFQAQGTSSFLAPVLPAGRGLIYAALYKREGKNLVQMIPETSMTPEDFLNQLTPSLEEICFLGPDSSLLPVPVPSFVIDHPRASSSGLLAIQESMRPVPFGEIHLNYLQAPDFGEKKFKLVE